MPPADPSATLEAIKARSAAALEFPASGFAEDSIRACTQSALDVPSLVAALEAVLKLHVRRDRPVRTHHICMAHGPLGDDEGYNKHCAACRITEKYVCEHCRRECPDDDAWPCPTVLAITREITGKGESDGG